MSNTVGWQQIKQLLTPSLQSMLSSTNAVQNAFQALSTPITPPPAMGYAPINAVEPEVKCDILIGITGYGWDMDPEPHVPGERYIHQGVWDFLRGEAADCGYGEDVPNELFDDVCAALDKHLNFPALKKLKYMLGRPRDSNPLVIADISTKAEENLIRKHGGKIWRIADPRIDAKYMGIDKDALPYMEREIGEIDFDEMIYCGEAGNAQERIAELLKEMGWEAPKVVDGALNLGAYVSQFKNVQTPYATHIQQHNLANQSANAVLGPQQVNNSASSLGQLSQSPAPASTPQALLGYWADCFGVARCPLIANNDQSGNLFTEGQARQVLGIP